ncbi:MAG: hypothetical protein ACJ798_19340 [Phenylobacterium sp.]
MTLHQFAPIFPVAIAMAIAVGASGWSVWHVNFAYRARGRRAVERMLESRGETLLALRKLPFREAPVRTGLTSLVVFEVRARTADGEERAYEWAYEPRIFPWQTEGLKRLAHGIWIAA